MLSNVKNMEVGGGIFVIYFLDFVSNKISLITMLRM